MHCSKLLFFLYTLSLRHNCEEWFVIPLLYHKGCNKYTGREEGRYTTKWHSLVFLFCFIYLFILRNASKARIQCFSV